jgi:Predicted membrane protein
LDILNVTIKLVVGFISLFLVTRLLGKTQINQITPFDFVSAMVMGELFGNIIYDREVNVFYAIYATALWGVLIMGTDYIAQRFLKTRSFLEGNPDVIIRNGIIDQKVMKKNMLDINTLLEMLRQKDVFTIQDVEYAILEASGTLSVLKKSAAQPVSREDLQLPVKPVNLATAIIIDGELLWRDLEITGLNIKDLKEEIEKRGYKDVKDIFYAEWMEGRGLIIQGYTD